MDQDNLVSNSEYGELVDEVDYPGGLEGGGGDGGGGGMRETRTKKPNSYVPLPFVSSLPCYNMSKRYQIAFLSSLGFLISFGIRCNMGVAVVVMVHNQTVVDKNGNVTVIVSSLGFFLAIILQTPITAGCLIISSQQPLIGITERSPLWTARFFGATL